MFCPAAPPGEQLVELLGGVGQHDVLVFVGKQDVLVELVGVELGVWRRQVQQLDVDAVLMQILRLRRRLSLQTSSTS